MSRAHIRLLSPKEYLEQERHADFRSEYLRGEVFAMAGATFAHSLIKDNVAAEARSQLKDGPCRVVTSDLRVRVEATGLYTYPDIVIVCDEPSFDDNVLDTLLNPRTLVEVLSESTEKYDRGAKFAHYRQIPSLAEYVLVAQDRPLVERYVRQKDNDWLLTEFKELSSTFEFASVPVRIHLAEIYRGVTFPETPGR
ncbi:MAG: Uma2 family endonuclease [Gemmataceae bacterium]|nr:Uma2 family endonuclease [Gemmataceae bacterium]MCI0737941.1 Uma2 family endonuclease [Gemmataceae bacterium]